ncbi:DUF4221 family protein [Algoriphagus hitonicola]|uniref:DUF4221 domain-containing protein n=1 Tax=Algoriphagus hitonicola TaxID=435880 RepID=A0A1I2QF48_9BACT|nr:DUF4221 family protein [Algoriphagus hitonicola]SFG24877.1 protein of unknown function [Algoriphagus hitonicola]
MKQLIFLAPIVSFFFFSCDSKEEKSLSKITFDDLIVDTLVLEKDENIAQISQSLTYMETDTGTLLLDFQKFQLVGFSYPEGKKVLEQFYMREGSDGVGDSPFKHAITEEGIFVISADTKLIQADFKGNVLARWELPGVPAERLYVNYSVVPSNPISKTGNELIIADVPHILKEGMMDYQNWILRYDLEDQTSSHIQFSFPERSKEHYDDPNLGPYSHYFNSATEETLVSFPISDSLLLISDKEKKWIAASTDEKLEFLKGRTDQQGEYTVFLPDNNSPRYTWIKYDPVNKVYLRQVITGTRPEAEREEKGAYKVKLIVLDENFEKLGELEMPGNGNGFSTPEGFYYAIGFLGGEEEVGFVRLDFSKMKP